AERDARWPAEDAFGTDVPALSPRQSTPLFPRIDDKRGAALLDKWLPKEEPGRAERSPGASPDESKPVFAPAPIAATITYDDFARLDLRVGHVVAAEAVPKARKLLKLSVDLGEGRHRTIVAGIAEAFQPAALVGRRVLVVANLAPREMRGVTSEGMILAAGDDAILALGTVDADAPPGTRVK
ncbi:MAG: methionine--tRNA ligase subunit beta, partial [Deltaproteobacteria bacterium]|nr:methionine--tRNA ligase subunit beta [Kofleriaceae bacterium]